MTASAIARLLDRLVVEIPERVTRAGYGRDTCILHARVAVDELRGWLVPARPLAVRAIVGNAQWAADTRQLGHIPTDAREWSPGTWCVGVGYGLDPRAERAGYDGHVIVVVDERYAVDLTLDQMSRPAKGIELSPHWWELPSPAFVLGEGSAAFRLGNGSVVIYDAMPDERGFLSAPDWRCPPAALMRSQTRRR